MTAQPYKPDIVIYHDECRDGFAAALSCWLRWGNTTTIYIAANYGWMPPVVSGKHVLIVDFSYKADVMRRMAAEAASIIVLDHHKSAASDLADWIVEDVAGEFWAGDDPLKAVRHNDEFIGQPIAALFDMNRSGARMAWDFCHDTPPPRLIELVEDRDLWRFAYGDDSRAAHMLLSVAPRNFSHWAELLEMPADALDQGRALLAYYNQLVAKFAARAHGMWLDGHFILAANCPPEFASDVGNELLKLHAHLPFAATYNDGKKARGISLRSTDERIDVSTIAAKFGGGGHRNAAGFGMPIFA